MTTVVELANSLIQSGPSEFSLLNEDEKVMGTVEIESRYVPVPVVLEPRESVNSKAFLSRTAIIV